MEDTKAILKDLAAGRDSRNLLFKRNLLKEYLQIMVLDFIYSSLDYNQLVFYGGSCLAHCFSLPRLSEDLDFVDLKKNLKFASLAKDLENYFRKQANLTLSTAVQKFRIYLKFPLLHELGLAGKGESDLLFLKVEVFQNFTFRDYKTETIPLFKFNRSILIKTFDLPTLMATKLGAIFHRKWEKTDKKGKTLIAAKGRDYFDLLWYLEKGVKPNLACLKGIASNAELKEKLLLIVNQLDAKSIQLDLEAFIDNTDFIKNLSGNLKEMLIRDVGLL